MTDEPDEPDDMGPKMAALTPKQRAWVYALVETGGKPYEAAWKAGYGEGAGDKAAADNRCRQAGFHNSRNRKVQDAIREEAGHRLFTGALIGASVLVEIATDPTHKDRLKAGRLLLEHNGYQVIAQQEMKVTHVATDDKAMIARITELAGKLGLDPAVLLGRHATPVDAEFKVLEDKREPAGTASGLEDLL